jgi:hypothetical protein
MQRQLMSASQKTVGTKPKRNSFAAVYKILIAEDISNATATFRRTYKSVHSIRKGLENLPMAINLQTAQRIEDYNTNGPV